MMQCRFLWLILLLPLLAGCQHKPLCYDYPHESSLYVVFDWKETSAESDPPLMTVYFYGADQKTPYKYFLSGKTGGKVKLPSGIYNVLCYNDDVDELFVDEEDGFFKVLGYTRTLEINDDTRGDESDNEEHPIEEPIISSAGRLLVGNLYAVEVENAPEEEQTIILTPERAYCHYTCTFRHVNNGAYLSGIRCALSGMARGVQLYDKQLIQETAEILFPMDFEGESLQGKTETFGSLEVNHLLSVTMQLTDGTIHRNTFDVTQQVNEAPNPQQVEIVIDWLNVPKPETYPSGGGFNPGVSDWNDWIIDVDMRQQTNRKDKQKNK